MQDLEPRISTEIACSVARKSLGSSLYYARLAIGCPENLLLFPGFPFGPRSQDLSPLPPCSGAVEREPRNEVARAPLHIPTDRIF